MDTRHMGQAVTDLPEKRIAKYRHMAADARESATKAKTREVKDAYNSIASVWEALAVELQAKPRKRPKDLLASTQKLPGLPIPPR